MSLAKIPLKQLARAAACCRGAGAAIAAHQPGAGVPAAVGGKA